VSPAQRKRVAERPALPVHLVPIIVVGPRPQPPLTRRQTAELLSLHPRSVDRWIRRGRLRTIDLGGTVRIAAADAERARAFEPWTRFG
jgi:excisionase family DNA binding protein